MGDPDGDGRFGVVCDLTVSLCISNLGRRYYYTATEASTVDGAMSVPSYHY